VNHVVLVGRLEQVPESRPATEGYECLLELAVPRRQPGGGVEPGVSYVQVVVSWPHSRQCSELKQHELLAVSGLVRLHEFRNDSGDWERRQDIVADWVERLDERF
jgi:single-stranded DNA-binding protein